MKTLSKRQFRILLGVYLLTTTLGFAVSSLGEYLLPPALRAFEQEQLESDITTSEWVLLAVSIPVLVAAVVALVGLFRFWPLARPLVLALTALGIIIGPFGGPVVETGLAATFDWCSTVLGGMVLALIYLSPVADWFVKPTDSAPTAETCS